MANYRARVLYFIPNVPSISEQFLERHIRMLKDANILSTIITGFPGPAEVRPDWMPIIFLREQNPIRRLVRGAMRRLGSPVRYPSIGTLFYQLDVRPEFNVVFCEYGTWAVQLIEVFKNHEGPSFVHVHGYDTTPEMCYPGYLDDLAEVAQYAIMICNSQETRRRLLSFGISPERLLVKYMGVEIAKSPTLRQNTGRVKILQLGRLVDCKGPDRTIKAFELACSNGLDGELILAGDGPLREVCENIRNHSPWRDRIEILGSVTAEQGERLRQECDIFTLHSIKGPTTGQVEAFGVAVVEAMAASLPVVSCRIGGIVEIIVHNQTGFLGEPDDIEGQAASLLSLACDPDLRREMGSAGWQRVHDLFSYEREEETLLSIIETSLGANQG